MLCDGLRLRIHKQDQEKTSQEPNQLAKVTDSSSGNDAEGFIDGNKSGDDYTYDLNGNLKTDKNKNITEIIYNHLNLPTKITFGSTGNIVYIYNAVGQKIQKVVTEVGKTLITTDYLGGYQYENAVLRFFPTAEGYVKNTAGVYSYVFNYTDHVGNVRLSYGLNANVLTIFEENNYYPFGLKHKGYNEYTPTFNKYKFQGQERQDEQGLNWDSFKWRNYDYTIGRFMSIDPLTEKYMDWAPYVFSGNRVVDKVELEGLEPAEPKKNAGVLVLVIQGYEGNDPAKNKTQVSNNEYAKDKTGGLNSLSELNSQPKFQVVQFSSSDAEDTKNDMGATIKSFMKINPDGKVVLVGHSRGADNVMEFGKENPKTKIDLTVTLDISDGIQYNDDDVTPNVNTAVNFFIPSFGQPGGTEIEPVSGNTTSKVLNIPV